MIQYIYFVKCPGCEDEHFDFFNDAKECALSRLSEKPIITQIEVDRNDFGECVDSSDLGTIWSWEDMMKETDAEPAVSVFTKDDLVTLDSGLDPEFASIDNSVYCEIEEISDRKSISENAIHDGGFRTDGYRTALACYDSDDFDINVEFRLQDEEEYEVEDQLYLLRPGQTVADLVVYLSRKCGFTNVYVYGETSATRGEMKTATRFETEPGTHDYRHYGTIEDRLVEKCDKRARKPIPEGMTIEQLVEEMEENEDTVECTWCEELFDKSECRKEVDLGWLCSRCEAAIKSRGETLTFKENNYWDFLDEDASTEESLEEAIKPKETVDLEYDELTITVFGPQRDVDDWDEAEYTDSYTYTVAKEEVATAIWEIFITDEDVADVPGGLETLEDDTAWEKFLETHFDTLFEKYYKQLLEYFRDAAKEEFEEKYSWDEFSAASEARYNESCKKESVLEELEEPDTYRKRLILCPECGVAESFDNNTGFCINCGFNI
jgi:hypothetical protein